MFYAEPTARPAREADPARNVPREPRSETETFRRFATYEDCGFFVIVELEPTNRFPLNWGLDGITREAAWRQAQAQPSPVLFIGWDGEVANLGVVFDQEVSYRAAYAAYVSQGRADSDAAFYAPLSYESWLASERPTGWRS